MSEGRGVVWPPKGVEPAAPAAPRPGARLQPWRTPSAEPRPSRGQLLAAALADAADGMAALGHAAQQAAAAVPLPPDERAVIGYDPVRRPSDAVVAVTLAQYALGVLAAEHQAPEVPARTYVAPPVDPSPGWLGRLRRRLFGEPPQ